jgi:hypothetical protein
MTDNIMTVIKTSINENGTTEYYLVGLECWDDYETVLNELVALNIKVIESLDGIHFRVATLEDRRVKFRLYYHEDVGVYLFVLGEQSASTDDHLRGILDVVVENINTSQYAK